MKTRDYPFYKSRSRLFLRDGFSRDCYSFVGFLFCFFSLVVNKHLSFTSPTSQLLALIIRQMQSYSESPFLHRYQEGYCLCFLLTVPGFQILGVRFVSLIHSGVSFCVR